MREGGKLTSLQVKNASEPGLYGDGLGLYLQVSKFGTKAWLFRFMLDGKARKMGLGAIHTVSLAEARKRANEARLKLLDGVDPIDERDAGRAKRKVEAAKAISFKACADKFIAANRGGWKNSKHADQWFATFNETNRGSLSFPAATEAINGLPVSAIDTALVLKVLEPIWAKTPESASRIRGRIESVLDWAKVREYRTGENPARWRGHLDKALAARPKVRKHHDAIGYADLAPFMAALREKEGVSARALEFTILTVARTGETIGAQWPEFDLKAKLWTVPAARMKAGREHRVPLPGRAVQILEALPRDGKFVFTGGRPGQPISGMAMLQLVRRMRGRGATVHGLRSTFRDWSAEQTAYPHELAEVALAHVISSKTEAAYRRGDMMDKRRRLMDDWAAFCEAPAPAGSNVRAIREIA
jgi:integrase